MQPAPQSPVPPKTPSIAIVGLVLALIGLCVPLLGCAGVIVSIIALVQLSKTPGVPGRALAIVGIVLPLVWLPVIAAIAVPNFIRFQSRSKQAECKTNLKALWTGERSIEGSDGHFSAKFGEIGFSPERANRYLYVLEPKGPMELRNSATVASNPEAGVIGADDYKYATSSQAMLDRLPLVAGGQPPHAGPEGFTAACIGNIDSDDTLDVWSISSQERTGKDGESIPPGQPYNDVSDITD